MTRRMAAIMLSRTIMRTITILIGLVLTTSPAFAQSKVYTNRDLIAGPVTWTRTVTPEELASLARRQFHLPQTFDGPTAVIIGQPYEMQPLAPYRPLSEPFYMSTYVGHGSYGGRGYRTGHARGDHAQYRAARP